MERTGYAQPRDGVTTRLITGGGRTRGGSAIGDAVGWVARTRAPGASPLKGGSSHMTGRWSRRRSGVNRVRRGMSISEHEGKVVEGRTSRARAPLRMSRNCAQHTAVSPASEQLTAGEGSGWPGAVTKRLGLQPDAPAPPHPFAARGPAVREQQAWPQPIYLSPSEDDGLRSAADDAT